MGRLVGRGSGLLVVVGAIMLGAGLNAGREGDASSPAAPPLLQEALPSDAGMPRPVGAADALFAELGCGACHTGVPAAGAVRAVTPSLDAVADRFSAGRLFLYLQNPIPTQAASGRARMPDFHLDEAESLALTLFLVERSRGRGGAGRDEAERAAERAFETARRRFPGVTAATGQAVFRSQNCAGCHVRSGESGWINAPDLSAEGSRVNRAWLAGFLREPTPVRPFGHLPGSGSRMPDFRLSPEEADTVVAHLMRQVHPALTESEAQHAPLSAFARAKAEALLRDQLPCLGCHALGGEGGRIGPELSQLRSRLRPAYVEAIVRDPQAVAPGSVMPPTPMPDEMRQLLVRYLLDAGGSRPPPDRLSLVETPIHLPAGRSEPELLYGRSCAACHGVQGQGDGYNARFLPAAPTVHASAESMAARPDDSLYDGIHAGGRILGRSPRMPAFGMLFTREQIRGLVAHIRALCRCEAPAWSRDRRS